MKKGETRPESKNELARNLADQFPHTSQRMLAKMLVKLHPLRFSGYDDAFNTVRAVVHGGIGTRRAVKSEKYKGPLSIPHGQLNDFSHYTVTGKRVGILCDIHIPYHEYDALSIAIDELQAQKIDTLILNGDIIDCYQLSDFDRKPTADSIKTEIEILCHFITDLQKAFPGIKMVYKFGNHEERWERVILRKAPMIWGFECFELSNLIKIEFMRIVGKPLEMDFVSNKRIIDVGSLGVVHGHEWREGTFSPVNPARGYFIRAKTSVLGGDKHQTSEHITSDMNGKIIGSWSVGSLCDLHPQYMPMNNWNLGFAYVHRLDDEAFEVRNYKIINGKLV